MSSSITNAFPGTFDYHSRWKRELADGWIMFKEQWWGPAGKARLHEVWLRKPESRIIQLETIPGPFLSLTSLHCTKGRILVRNEYTQTHARLTAAFDAGNSGVILTGSPGIGKSYFIIYILLARMANEQITIITFSDRESYLFDKEGVWSMHSDNLKSWEDIRTSIRPWSLIDADMDKLEPAASLTSAPLVFSVQAVSPDPKRYRLWKKGWGGIKWYMNPWTEAERLQLHDVWKSEYTIDDIVELSETAGPCIRDLVAYLTHPRDFVGEIWEVFWGIRNISDLVQLFYQTTQSSESSHEVFILHRNGDGVFHDSDEPVIDCKSLFVLDLLSTKFANTDLTEVRYLYTTFDSAPESNLLASWMFRKLAIHCTSLPRLRNPHILLGLHLMKQDDGNSSRFTHDPRSSTEALVVLPTAARAYIRRPERPLSRNVSRSGMRNTLPLKQRAITPFMDDDVDTIDLSAPHYFIPQDKKHFFDAFFFEQSSTGPGGSDATMVLWILQTLSVRRPRSFEYSFETIRSLQQRVVNEGMKSPDIKYVLLAPQNRGRKVSWTLPQGWEAVSGEVYIQYLDLQWFLANGQ
ncbi:hypothetical protein VNI00_012425 [Paramarasmius palmivorus]|uniref:Uncharacterized protein n=1 Tax=Paramarasmius palmivorus TaxID=297713 RepID=A0AAW0C8G8_9AGAR